VATLTYDARGLVEVDGTPPGIAEIDGARAEFDARELTTRKINAELRRLVYQEGIRDVTILNPGARHSLGVGILQRCKITFEGSLGYFGLGLIDGPEVHVKGRVGWSACENMMSGVVIVDGNAGSMTGFMMQRGRQILLGDVGPGLGDSMYDGEIYVAGKVKALGVDCVPGEWTDADTEFIERKFRIYGLGSPPELQKFVCGKQLYNYDNLEPSERKLVL
jgi:glutamate synthase domain-containing protein 3